METSLSASKKEKMNEDEGKSINAPALGGSDLTSHPARGTWDSLPDLVQETILKMVNKRKTLLACRLVNTAWKKVADKTLEQQSISEWTKWNPLVGRVQSSIPRMKFITDRVEGKIVRMQWNHSPLPIIVSQKLGSPFPTNSMHMMMDSGEEDNSEEPIQWPPTYKKCNRIQMMRDLFSSYGNFLTCISLSHLIAPFEVLNGMLSDMRNLKAIKLDWVGLATKDYWDECGVEKEENDAENEEEVTEMTAEEEEESPLPNLPSLPNLSHLKITTCGGRISQLFFNSYGGQITTLETDEYHFIDICPQPFTNLKQLKLGGDMGNERTLLLPQLGPTQFPSLQYFSFRQRWGPYKWEKIIQAVDRLSNKLVHLHLDFAADQNNEMNIQNLNKNMSTFPDLRKFGIGFPRNKIQTETIGMWLLSRFPNVNALDLIDYPLQYDYGDRGEVTIDDKGSIHHVVETVAAGFWKKCSELEKILVYLDKNTVLQDVRRDTKM